ncbi:HAD-IC family P-type ATPase [Sinomonas atrocyanea]|uniref:HAD-IC family P-type ATPase n=1 Tax=Sinomonas atrocyanea TaxID=37927 RepID=UPI002787CB09|nr:HAD-IC family P-type ATPase [Sinomonas atrocyanea]MDQ0261569.1 cation-transporting ATPase E [Sinomonas atrocyanea]MDR6623269.1 cation-transporting ATPase E [Sinomonas atrocyanea]
MAPPEDRARSDAASPAGPLPSTAPPDLGLDAAAVAEREAAGLVNTLDRHTSRPVWQIARSHLFTVFNLILGLCGATLVALGRWLDLMFLAAAAANITIGFVQELQAKRRLDRLAVLEQSPVRVLRSGAPAEVAPDRVVMDDVVLLRRGDQIPVDGTVLGAEELDVDESMLTGESVPVSKAVGSSVSSGSSVVAGHGSIRVTALGAGSRAERLTAEARRFTEVGSELRDALARVVRWISLVIVPMIAVVLNGQLQAAGGWAASFESGAWRDALVAAVASVTIMVPQGLALLTTVSFAVAAVRLARGRVLVEELAAVEVLARVDVLCFDKTGTLTEGGIHVEDAFPVHGPAGPLPGWDRALAWIGADPDANPTAAALAERFSAPPDRAPSRVIPFSSARRWSAVQFDGGTADGAWLLGAPETLLGQDPGSAPARQAAAEAAVRGLRAVVLCRADRLPAGGALPARVRAAVVLAFRERLRPDAAETLAYFREQGVDLKVVSGDSPGTVAAAARAAGMDAADPVDARTLPEDPAQLADALERHSVFGRVGPEQKRAMVRALQARGHVVAMTGDGVNDALALKAADLGIAMGTAAPATKAVARLVLLDGRFSRLPAVVAEGRQVIANIERVSRLFLTKTVYAFLLGISFGALAWAFPFLPRQLSTSDFLMLGFPASVLALLPNTRRYVPGFLRRAVTAAVPSGLAMAVAILGVYAYGRWATDASQEQIEAAAFITLTVSGLWVLVIAARPLTRWRLLLVGSMYAGTVAVLTVPASLQYHQLADPDAQLTLAALAFAAGACVVIEAAHQVLRRRLRA